MPAGTDALQAAFGDFLLNAVGFQMYPILVAATCASLNPPSAEYFRRTREAMFGKPLEELGTEENWKAFERGGHRPNVRRKERRDRAIEEWEANEESD